MIDKNGRLFGKLNIIDVVIIIIVIALASFAAYRVLGTSKGIISAVNKEKTELVFINSEIISDYVEGKIKEGDHVFDRNTNAYFGVVTKVEISESHSYAATADGRIEMVAKPEYSYVKVTVEGSGVYLDKGGITFDNTDYYMNRNLDIKIGNAVMQIRLSDFKKIN